MQVNVIGIEVERILLEDQFHNLRIESNEIQNDQIEEKDDESDQTKTIEELNESCRQL